MPNAPKPQTADQYGPDNDQGDEWGNDFVWRLRCLIAQQKENEANA